MIPLPARGRRSWPGGPALAAALALLVAAPLASTTAAGARGAATELVGTFAITPGTCDGAARGSFFRMMTTGGASYIENGDSVCADKTYSPLLPGTDGGLVTGTYQPAPSPPFDSGGNGTATAIVQPVPFFGVAFAASTEAVDPQTGLGTPVPSITIDDAGQLGGSTAAFGAAWNNQTFNQGSPKPDGSQPGNTSGPSGTYDASSGAFTLTWQSQIVGGPFNSFTGVWHLEGTFTPRAGAPAAPAAEPAAAPPPAPAGGASTDAAPGAAATVPAGLGASTATTAASVESQAAASVSGESPSAGAVSGGAAAADSPSGTAEGWEPAAWLVVLVAAFGAAGLLSLLWLSRPAVRADR